MKITEEINKDCYFCKGKLGDKEYKIHNTCIDDIIKEHTNNGKLRLERGYSVQYNDKYINKYVQRNFDLVMKDPDIFPNYDLNYERKISSYSEVSNCDDRHAGDADIKIANDWKDRDAAPNKWDSYVLHNSNIDRPLRFLEIGLILDTLKFRNRICMITGPDTWNIILDMFSSFFTPSIDIPIPMHPVEFFRINSYCLSDYCFKDIISRIYFINIDDIEINEPWLHGKLRDLM